MIVIAVAVGVAALLLLPLDNTDVPYFFVLCTS